MIASICEIPLTQGQVAIVDEADFELVSQYNWHAVYLSGQFYAATSIGRRTVYMHRLIMGEPEGIRIDHRDGVTLHNRRHNLRQATHAQNMQNRRRRKSGQSSQYMGVTWDKRRSKWLAKIETNGRTRHLGHFVDEADAGRAYDAAARELYGEFARLNFPAEASA